MVYIQIRLDDDENRVLSMYKLMYKLNTKEEAIKRIIRHTRLKALVCEMESKLKDKNNVRSKRLFG